MLNVLIACEESQAITKELRKKNINAFSCDIKECSGGEPGYHIKSDVLTILNPTENNPVKFKTCDNKIHIVTKWDVIIAHPPCTDLAVSGARWFDKKRENGTQENSIKFFIEFLKCNCEHVCIENPIGIMSGGEYIKKYFPQYLKYCKEPTQIIQPFEFGDPFKKSTCLWLKGLKPLKTTKIVEPNIVEYICKNGKKVRFSSDYSSGNGTTRSKTYPGIAKAISEQWF